MTDAEARLSLLWLAGHDPDAVDKGVQHFENTYATGAGAPFEDFAGAAIELAEQVRENSTMTGELRRTWSRLRARIKDEQISTQLEELQESVVVGAVRGGDVSAASMRFPDGSHLVVVDHGLSLLTWHAAALIAIRWTPTDGEDRSSHSERASAIAKGPRSSRAPGTDSGSGDGDSDSPPLARLATARALRLATSRLAVGGRAGVIPPLVLSRKEMEIASRLTFEMDVFVLGHELAHVLLRHLDARNSALGIVGGDNRLLGKQIDEEFDADQFALMLMFNDALHDGEVDESVAQWRLAAVRTFMTVLEEYEEACFLFAPSTHPPARMRWEALKSRWIDLWFPDLNNPVGLVQTFVDDLIELRRSPRSDDAHNVHRHLASRLDSRLWSYDDWADVGQVARMVCGEPGDATDVLNAWQRRHPDRDATSIADSLLARMLQRVEVHSALRSCIADGRSLTRLAATELLLADLPDTVQRTAASRDPFPAWTVSLLAQASLRESLKAE